jgi:hypothetical protein
MEVTTCVVGSVVLYFVRFPFLTMPVAITLWLMSMDLTAVLYSKSSWYHDAHTTRPTTRHDTRPDTPHTRDLVPTIIVGVKSRGRR